jgi:hypothetical protein
MRVGGVIGRERSSRRGVTFPKSLRKEEEGSWRLTTAGTRSVGSPFALRPWRPARSVHRSFEGPGQIRSRQSPIWPIQRSRQRDTLQVTGLSYPIRYVPDRTLTLSRRAEQRRVSVNSESTRETSHRWVTLSLSTKLHGIPENWSLKREGQVSSAAGNYPRMRRAKKEAGKKGTFLILWGVDPAYVARSAVTGRFFFRRPDAGDA